MSALVELVDLLQPVHADGTAGVHLADHGWTATVAPTTLCGLSITLGPPLSTYLKAGCLPCAHRAVKAGIYAVHESDRVVINLRRLVDSWLRSWEGSARILRVG